MQRRRWSAVQLWELDGLLLPSVLAAASRLASYSLVGLLGHLLPDGDHTRALLCLSAHVLCRMCSCLPQGNGSRQTASTSLQFLQDIDRPVHGIRPTTARPHLHRLTCINSLRHALTAPTNPCAPRRDRWDRRRWRRRWTSSCSHSSTPRCSLPRVDREAAPAVPQRLVAPLGGRTVDVSIRQYLTC